MFALRSGGTQPRQLLTAGGLGLALALGFSLMGARPAVASRATSGTGTEGSGGGSQAAGAAALVLSGRGAPIVEAARGTLPAVERGGEPWIHLGAGFEFNPQAGDPAAALGPEWRAANPGPGERGYYIVQFDGPITPSDRGALDAVGATFVSYVPDYGFLVGMSEAARGQLAATPSVTWIGLFQPAWKISRQDEMSDPGSAERVVLLFPDAEIGAAQSALALTGSSVKQVSDNGINKIMRVEIPAGALSAVARIPSVAWIEPYRPLAELHNSSAQWVVQTATSNNRHVWDKGIKGQGQVINLSDSGIRTTHNQFKDPSLALNTWGDYPTHRKIIAYWKTTESTSITFGDHSANSYHGTHTSGTAGGNDAPNAGDARDGMALESKIYFQDGGGTTYGIYTALDLNDQFIGPYNGNAGGAARISTHSWGNSNGGAYDVHSMTVDQFMWAHPDFLAFFSNGNDGGVNTVGSPATAKDCVSAGGTGNGAAMTNIYSSTSRGPTDDGRRKPTICSPGDIVSSAYGSGDANYISYSGTSMASPSMAGATALIRQYLAEGWYPTMTAVPANAMNPSAALMKAMAINSADPNVTGYTIPDNNIGWGRIDVDNVLPFGDDATVRRLALVDNTEGLLTGEYVEYQVYVAASSQPLKVSVVWTDYAGSPANAVQLVNNLDLTATDGVTTYKGNVYSGGQSTTGGSADNLNVEECVQRNTPTVGLWTIRVTGTNVPVGPQPFALVVTGSLGSDQGLLTLDAAAYPGTGNVGIRLIDTNLLDNTTVTVTSDSETGTETVAMTGSAGVFAGSIPLSIGYPVDGDGVLQVSDGDEITVTYNDASPAVTMTARAMVNLSGPTISAVHVTGINETDVTVAWTSSTPGSSRVYYGVTTGLGSVSPLDASMVSSHSLVLSGLSAATTYYYDVESVDNQGNTVRDDNGGFHYTFSTDQNRDVLVVIGDATFDKTDYYVNALNRAGWTHTIWEGDAAADPFVGDKTVGMASYKAVVFQTGLEQYPMMTDAARDSIAKLNTLGSRTAVYSNDLAWDFCDPASPDYTAARCSFVGNEFKVTFNSDPTTISSVRGIASDPISGAYTAGIPYTPHRDGAACDEIDGIATGGSFAYVWRDNDTSVDDIAVRWVSTGNVGDPSKAVWGGTPRKVSTNEFEWAHLNVGNADDVTRADVLDKTLLWLIGHDHPTATVTAPNGGETLTGNTTSLTWTEAVDAGYSVASRKLYYSDNSGDSWTLITAAAGPSPYLWTISSIPNGAQYRVKVVVADNASPALSAADASNADFTINRPGGDTRAPLVLAGSIVSNPNPIVGASPATLSATVSDVTTGNSNVAAAEWSFGAAAAPAGTGTAMSGSFTSPVVNVSAVIPGGALPSGAVTLWVRGKDAANNWGNASSLAIQVNTSTGVESSLPAQFALRANAPNPFNPRTSIRYDVPRTTRVSIGIYDLGGRLVRTLFEGAATPGTHVVGWDGRDDHGRESGSGVYFYKMAAEGFEATRKMTLLK